MKRLSKNSKYLIFSALAILIVSLLIYGSSNKTEHFLFRRWRNRQKKRLKRLQNAIERTIGKNRFQWYIKKGNKGIHWCTYPGNNKFCTANNVESNRVGNKNECVESKHKRDSSIRDEYALSIKNRVEPTRDNCGCKKDGSLYEDKKFWYYKYKKIPNAPSWDYQCILERDDKYAPDRNPYNEYRAYEAIRKFFPMNGPQKKNWPWPGTEARKKFFGDFDY